MQGPPNVLPVPFLKKLAKWMLHKMKAQTKKEENKRTGGTGHQHRRKVKRNPGMPVRVRAIRKLVQTGELRGPFWRAGVGSRRKTIGRCISLCGKYPGEAF